MDKNDKKMKVNFHHDELANDGLHKGFGDISWTHREKDLVEFVINNFSHVNELEKLVKENALLHSVSECSHDWMDLDLGVKQCAKCKQNITFF